jgi:hypothetical protein
MISTGQIDSDWENFISSNYDDITSNEENEEITIIKQTDEEFLSANLSLDINTLAPKATDIYISTKTKIAYLNTPIDLKDIFWKIPVIMYATPSNGVIKKQIKFNSLNIDELEFIQEKLKSEVYFEEYIITHINNPIGRIKFKDTRKVSIGISKKDIMSYRCKKKSAFYNCFVLILRMKINDIFKEFHVKVFNTGKLEIPGVQNEGIFDLLLVELLSILQIHFTETLYYKENNTETVLINSNFNCGFYINRETLCEILKMKYGIQSIYDPCSYPGIQCKFYYKPDYDIQNGCQISEENKHLNIIVKEISFMIFRTGSVLIVGRCDENVLLIIYDFLKIILNNEFNQIHQKNVKPLNENMNKLKKKKIRKKTIIVSS